MRRIIAAILLPVLPLALHGCADYTAAERAPADAADPVVMAVATTSAPALARVGDVTVYRSGYGSGLALAPDTTGDVYLLTDRGPNVDGANPGIKLFPVPDYAPRIYRARVAGTELTLTRDIPLRRPDGSTMLSGLPIPEGHCGATLETGWTLAGQPLASDAYGVDPEGIVALADGTFWLSDEYGPFLLHYAADGRELARLSPCNGGLPAVYALRRPNRGMEGLTITPDGQWLVGIMQSPLEHPSAGDVRDRSRAIRILFRHTSTGATREYLYLLETPATAVSEITALTATTFLVLERDGEFLFGAPRAAHKRIYEIDIADATDVSELGALGNAPFRGRTLEQASSAALRAARIAPVHKRLAVDLLALGYPHDKAEGMAVTRDGVLLVVNDDDFGVVSHGGALLPKRLPPGSRIDAVTIWQIRLP